MKVNCKSCNKEFEKRNTEIIRHPNNFCSRSCSAKFNNKGKQKNPPKERVCKKCGLKFKSGPHNKRSKVLCLSCREIFDTRTKYLKSKTLKEYHELLSVKGKHPSWKNAHIRCLNRSWNKDILGHKCKICGYDKHIEYCHIKSVTSFPETAKLEEVNHPTNNVVLCPNHHWELDNGIITL